MSAFAIYRLPHADHCIRVEQTDGEPAELLSCTDLNGKSGFVVAPFEVTPDQPILLIRPEKVERLKLKDESLGFRGDGLEFRVDGLGFRVDGLKFRVDGLGFRVDGLKFRDEGLGIKFNTYSIDFANYHSQLLAGTFSKIVLARCVDEETPQPIDPMQLFHSACLLYPRMFISLVYTEKSGYWLTATPEILLESDNDHWRTIALAGTMRLTGDQLVGEGETVTWPTKDIQEQRIVTTYIAECLEQFTGDFHEEGPRTVRAANLVHLRSDFTFTLPDSQHLGDLLHALHPTPAVCGLPKRETFNFIVQNEHTPRRYYSGFMGPLDPEEGTHLYVSLRCMNIEGNRYHLYAGGGLLKDSTMEQEWQETEAKLETMRQCIAIKKT